jgi:hypothetical protein
MIKNVLTTANVQEASFLHERSLPFDIIDIRDIYTLVYINYMFVIGEEIEIWKEW